MWFRLLRANGLTEDIEGNGYALCMLRNSSRREEDITASDCCDPMNRYHGDH